MVLLTNQYVFTETYSAGFSSSKIQLQKSREIIAVQNIALAGAVVVIHIFTIDNPLHKGCKLFPVTLKSYFLPQINSEHS